MYIHLKPKRCRLASNSRYFVNIKYIIIYNVSIIDKYLNINRLSGIPPPKPRGKKPYSFLI